ncbi:MAG: transposase [Pseudobdellovibrionaceae bacterium]|nr:transposase [Pseudobdellovibrionaceae bacterium]
MDRPVCSGSDFRHGQIHSSSSLVALYRSKEWDEKNRLHHRTLAQTAQILLGLLNRWFPARKSTAIGDTGFGTSRVARFCSKKRNLQLVSKFYRDAALHEAAPVLEKKANGRPRKKGCRLPTPEETVEKTKKRKRLIVSWYGGGNRSIEVVSGKGFWHKTGQKLVEVSWVVVHDLTGAHRDEYSYTTNMSMPQHEIIETYTMRWSIEITFQESREYLRLESPKCHAKSTVLRTTPCLFGLYTIVVLLYLKLLAKAKGQTAVSWAGKSTITFSDMIIAVRREIWSQWVFKSSSGINTLSKLPAKVRRDVLRAVLEAA